MTRNLFLGADLRPALHSADLDGLLVAAGDVLDQVRVTDMPRRAVGLAAEIRRRRPDLVGLQEVALWRLGPLDVEAALRQRPSAQTVLQDFLGLLLGELNRAESRYLAAVVAQGFDIEAPARVPPGFAADWGGTDCNARLTMRDVILVRRGAGIKTRNPRTGQFAVRDSVIARLGGAVDVPVRRGWAQVDAKVRGSAWLRFGNVHLESFDDPADSPSVRARQAQAFADSIRVGQVRSGRRMPLVALGDFNSDLPGESPGEEQAFEVMRGNGFADIGTTQPLSCCIQGSRDLREGGSAADFDHRVDQIFTNTPNRVRPVKTWVTGRRKADGYWHSDHAGVAARLWIG
jgi:endonuclease/exonuclease/phosphatase family metal-dependent hydrolase